MRRWELIGVPYTSMARPGGIADAIAVLREGGLAARLQASGALDGGDLELEPPDGGRGPSGLLNERALSRLVTASRERVRAALAADRRPLLVGGDCPALLGPLAGVRDELQDAALVMVDGHEDAWPPPLSKTGEGSDSEVAIALGRLPGPLPSPLDALTPLVEPARLALLGPRDGEEIAAGGIRSIREEVALFLSDEEVAAMGAGAAMGAALDAVGSAPLWLHVDLDVLRQGDFPAVDYPQPGGLDWPQLEEMTLRALRDPRCRGVSVVIYNPDLDPSRKAAGDLVDFLGRAVERAGEDL